MNTNTGELLCLTSKEIEILNDEFIEVNAEDMTKKQKENQAVSLKDHRSKLGKKLTLERKQRKIQRNEPCVCGSEKKYKNCCLVRLRT